MMRIVEQAPGRWTVLRVMCELWSSALRTIDAVLFKPLPPLAMLSPGCCRYRIYESADGALPNPLRFGLVAWHDASLATGG
jgi:hypothetical protein